MIMVIDVLIAVIATLLWQNLECREKILDLRWENKALKEKGRTWQ